jgi:YHS domain-containing protein
LTFSVSSASAGILNKFLTGNVAANVSVGVTGNNALVISNITVDSPLTLNIGSTKTVTGVTFEVSDADGLADIVKTSFTYAAFKGAVSHAGTCTYNSDVGGKQYYVCNGDALMNFYDAPGTWNINVTGRDLGPGNYVSNDTQTFTVNSLKAFAMDKSSLSWTVTVGQTDKLSTDNPVTLTNQGNVAADIDVTAKNLAGVTSLAVFNAGNFTAAPTSACSGGVIALADSTAKNITGVNTVPGASSTQPLHFCIPLVPALPTDSYSATGGSAWEIAYA